LEDIQIAVKLSDERTLGLDPRQRVIHLIEGDVNTGESRDLLKLLNRDSVLNRYPPEAYTQRCYSYVPGVEAFPEVHNFACHVDISVNVALCVFYGLDGFESRPNGLQCVSGVLISQFFC
jgi:hypothetical protein